ncbi:MAG: hypothetical protein RXQ77_00040 [Candidatus Nanopusillus sp.]
MKRRGIDMAVQLIFVIIIMLVVAVIVIKLFQQQSSKISEISNTQIQQAVSDCSSYCTDLSTFCTKYENIGNGLVQTSPGYYVCSNAVPCSIVLQLYGGSSSQCQDQGFSISPLDCMYLECQNYIDNLYYSPLQATSYIFGNYSSTTYFNVTSGQENIQISAPSSILNPGPSQCSAQLPTWITNQVFGALLDIANYYNTADGCNLNLTVSNGILMVTGNCTELGINNNVNGIPLCQFLMQVPYSQLNNIPSVTS